MSELESFEGMARAMREAAASAIAGIESHRATCERFMARQSCEECCFTVCSCGEEATHTATLVGHNRRSAMCDLCKATWDRRQQFSGALNSIPAKWKQIRLGSADCARYVTGYATLAPKVAAYMDSTLPVVLRGHSGTGKTTLACAMLNEIIGRGIATASTVPERERARMAYFVSEIELYKAQKEGKPWDGDSSIVRRAMFSSVLVIDDLGQKPSEKATVITDIIEERYRKTLPTWITTFLTSEEVSDFYGAGVYRRLFEAKQFLLLGDQRATGKR